MNLAKVAGTYGSPLQITSPATGAGAVVARFSQNPDVPVGMIDFATEGIKTNF
jgi:hypothetical protein